MLLLIRIVVVLSLFLPLFGTWAEETLNTLSLKDKIAQLFMIASEKGYQQQVEELIKTYHVGGVLFLGRNTLAAQIDTTNIYQNSSTLPLLIAQDLEWGLSMRLDDALRFPRNLTLGALKDISLIYEIGKEIGKQCKALGVHLNLAPVIDINNNPANVVINDRSFGENKEKVAQRALLFMQGMQDAGTFACAKHFPGHGDTDTDSHAALPRINHSKERFESVELYPFKVVIKHNIKAIMNAHLLVPTWDKIYPSSLSKSIVTDLLRKELGFSGLIITDALNMQAITKHYRDGQAELQALLAGNDILLFPQYIPQALSLIEKAIQEGTFTEKELDLRVLKILKAKEELGLHKQRLVNKEEALQIVFNSSAVTLKNRLYQESLTLVKNEHHILPLTQEYGKHTFALVIGTCEPTIFTELLKTSCVIYTLSPTEALSQLEPLLHELKDKKTALIALFGMNKFSQKNYGISQETLQILKKLKEVGKKIILILFGSPYSLKFFSQEDALLVAYEDAIEAQQAAIEAIFGKQPATGTLPITASSSFKEGFGISFDKEKLDA